MKDRERECAYVSCLKEREKERERELTNLINFDLKFIKTNNCPPQKSKVVTIVLKTTIKAVMTPHNKPVSYD